VSWSQIIFGSLLVVALAALSAFIGWRQVAALLRLRGQSLPEEELRWERRKAYRRLVSSGLMVVMAVLLVVLLAFYEPAAHQLAEERKDLDPKPPLTPEQTAFVRYWGGTLIALLLVLLSVVLLAGLDLWATRRYALRQYRKLQADRRAMIERQASRLRQERNGPS
jgi:amino acid transporter